MDSAHSCSLHFQKVISTPNNTPQLQHFMAIPMACSPGCWEKLYGIQVGRGDSLEKITHLLEARAHLGGEPPSPANTTCMGRNLSRPHQLHSLQQGFGDTEMCGQQEGLRFALWLPTEAFWHLTEDLGTGKHSTGGKQGAVESATPPSLFPLSSGSNPLPPIPNGAAPQQAQLSSRMIWLFRALTCSHSDDPKKMLAGDVTDLSKSLFLLWHFLLSILRWESHRSGPHSPALEPSSKSSQLLLLKTLSPKG